jgi:WD40 repeat protein
MASDPPKVFISYSHDSQEHAQHVLELAERLRKDGVDAQLDQYVAGTPARGWPRWMEGQLNLAKFVLVVCTETYGRRFLGREESEMGKGADWEGSLITLELYHGRSDTNKFVPVLFERQDESFIPRPLSGHTHYLLSSEGNYAKLYDFLTGQAGVVPGRLGRLKPQARGPVEALRFGDAEVTRQKIGKLRGVLDLPPHYLPREEDLAGLKNKLLAGVESVAITGQGQAVGVQGMGGIGKTVLAAALAHDLEVRQAFPDDIYWLTIGQKPDVLALQNQLLRQLTGSKETVTTEQEAKDALREALEGRAALIVVDDAWTVDQADAFSVTAPPARLLITTRNNDVLIGLGAEEHRVDVLSLSDALKMLAEWVGQKSSDKLPPEAADVAKECGYLPLALAMIGAMIRLRPAAWKDALCRLRRADLEAIKRNFTGYPYPNLLRAIEVSVEWLDSADRERYLDLAVFPEDQPIPEEALRVLWNLDEVDTRDCMTRLVSSSLATWATDGTSLILHDLQGDLVHKRREKHLPGLHLRLVEAWDALPKLPDAYAWRWVAYHMMKAGRKDDLRRLLLNFNYLEAKLAADPNALIADYGYLDDEEALHLIQSALRLSLHVLARDPRQLPAQLTGRLLAIENAVIEDLVEQAAQKTSRPWLRPLRRNLTPPGGPLIRTFDTDPVNTVAVTPDGRRAVFGSRNGRVRLWDLESGHILRTFERHLGAVRAVAISSDGRWGASASDDQTLRLWDSESGHILRTFELDIYTDDAVAVAPDGRCVVSGGKINIGDSRMCRMTGALHVWDLESGETTRCLYDPEILSIGANVAVTPDGRLALSGSDYTLALWDLESGQTLHTLRIVGHTLPVSAVAVTPDGRLAVSGSYDKTVQVWDLRSGQWLHTLAGHTQSVSAVAITPDGRWIVSVSDDMTMRLWDLSSGQTLCSLAGHTQRVGVVAVTPDGRRVVSASDDQTMRVWDLSSGQTTHTLKGHRLPVNAVALTPDGRRAVSASNDNMLWLWDLETGQTLRILTGHTSRVNALAITPDGRHAVSASDDRTLQVWDLGPGRTLRTLGHRTNFSDAVAVDPAQLGELADSSPPKASLASFALRASGGKRPPCDFLDDGQSLRTLEGHTGKVSAVAVTPDGNRAVSGSEDQTLRLWDLGTGQTLLALEGHLGVVRAVAITSDGRWAVSASDDRTLRLWDLSSGQTLLVLKGHTSGVSAVVIKPNGRRAISASNDNTLRLWDLSSGQTTRILEGHTWAVNAVAVMPDWRRAVSVQGGWFQAEAVSGEPTLRLWDLESGKEIAAFTGESGMGSCAVTQDGQTIIVGDALGLVHFLRLVEADETMSPIGEAKIQFLINSG